MSTLTIPSRTIDQRREALAIANEVRFARARLKRDIAAGRVLVADVLADPPALVASMPSIELLRAVPHVGRCKAGSWLKRGGVTDPSRPVGRLTARQREELAAVASRVGRR